jgi:hypothetical protein
LGRVGFERDCVALIDFQKWVGEFVPGLKPRPTVSATLQSDEEQPQVLRLATLAQNDSQFFGGRSE